MLDESGNTLLQLAANRNSEKILIMLGNFVLQPQFPEDHPLYKEDQEKRKANLKLWINAKGFTTDQFTALHYASFYGNITSIKYLREHGADYTITNNHRINVMHVAAQGDSPIALYYFKQLGLDINNADKNGSTPLHWASFSGYSDSFNLFLELKWHQDICQHGIQIQMQRIYKVIPLFIQQ